MKMFQKIAVLFLFLSGVAGFSTMAHAHVKWFAPYIVEASPRSILYTLADAWFWAGLALVLVFFIFSLAVEKRPLGVKIQNYLDRMTNPLWLRLDDFVRVVIGVFFVAIFAVGGIYLTPDLKTSSDVISWSQLLIAALIFSRRTQALAAAGIILLWLLALRDYAFFHLLDYLALGVGVAAYLVLEASNNPDWRRHRFSVIRIGVSLALMWSSLEKFAYPDWFYPLVDERPYLTFGLPRDAFIPMAGLAEFTMGFGLLWTPLIRRLSAIALFIIFTAAVYPFGRIDLVGHALIMAVLVAIIADHSRDIGALSVIKQKLAGVPLGLAAALVIFFGAYWGTHGAIYGFGNVVDTNVAVKSTHSFDPAHPHETNDAFIGTTAQEAYREAMDRMHRPMMEGIGHADPDMAFVLGMLPHHVGAINMAEIQLRYGDDPEMRELARQILKAQDPEVEQMRAWLKKNNYNYEAETSPAGEHSGH